jgi:polyisoprenoid-binding protein YceI
MKLGIFSFLVLFSMSISHAADFEIVKDKTNVEFEAKGMPSLLTIKGLKGSGIGNLKIVKDLFSGEIFVDLNNFDTDIDTRNEHMKEKYLETGKANFNISKLKFNSVLINKDFLVKAKKIENQKIEGLLSLHGVDKNIDIQLVEMNAVGSDEISGIVTFKVKLTDFGIEIPSFAGITIADEVLVKSNFVAKAISNKK